MAKKKKPARNTVMPEKKQRIEEAGKRRKAEEARQARSPAALVVYLDERRKWFWAVWQRSADDKPVTGGFATTQAKAEDAAIKAAGEFGYIETWTGPSVTTSALKYLEENGLLR